MEYRKRCVEEDCTREVAFAKTEEKIDNSFACGYGTVLFFEDQTVVKGLQEAFPSYQENFPDGHCRLQRCISWLFG